MYGRFDPWASDQRAAPDHGGWRRQSVYGHGDRSRGFQSEAHGYDDRRDYDAIDGYHNDALSASDQFAPRDGFASGSRFGRHTAFAADPFAPQDAYASPDGAASWETYAAEDTYAPRGRLQAVDRAGAPDWTDPAYEVGPPDPFDPGDRTAPWDGVGARDRFDIRQRQRRPGDRRHGHDAVAVLDDPQPRGLNLPGPLGLAALVAVLLLTFGVGATLLSPNLSGGRVNPAEALAGKAEVPAGPGPGTSPTAVPTATGAPSPSGAAKPTRTPQQSGERSKPEPSKSATTTLSKTTITENRVVTLTNAERAKAGCGALHIDEHLRTAARKHSQDMAARDYFSHTSPDGRLPWDRAAAAGYPEGTAMGENIAMGQPTPADVVTAWMNSEGHRANILNCKYKAIGVGLAYQGRTPIWTQLFGGL